MAHGSVVPGYVSHMAVARMGSGAVPHIHTWKEAAQPVPEADPHACLRGGSVCERDRRRPLCVEEEVVWTASAPPWSRPPPP